MLPKKARLTTAEFDRIFATGKRFHSPTLQLIYSPTADFHGAVVVGKKVYKNAVDRNKLRRRIYNVLYKAVAGEAVTGTYIFIAKPTFKTILKGQCVTEIVALLQQVALSRK